MGDLPPDAAELERLEARLRELDREREVARRRIEELRARSVPALPLAPPVPRSTRPRTPAPSTTPDKIRLFRSLFRGREDVFPRRWEKPGKAGYAPVCENEWVAGLCNKPRVRCRECPHRAFVPVSDQVVLDHLNGRTIGVYPMLADETCWFVAADFDEAAWQEDVLAFAETGRGLGIDVAVERSRSGKGAHAWIFFAAPVPAALARNVASFVLTETMSRRPQLSMRSYDRLFPAQDSMPQGGFGNLIALPYQDGPRRAGNSVFVDDALQPVPDPWDYLANVQRVTPEQASALARDATSTGRVLGVRAPETEDEQTPWLRLPSGRPRTQRIEGPLPERVRVVLAQRVFVETSEMSPALVNRIKRIAAFQNPEFHRKQRMRLSTRGTPRVISRAEDHAAHVSIPRGCLADVAALLDEHGIAVDVDDQRELGQPLDCTFHGELTPLQDAAGRALLSHDQGVLVAPPGVGKTVLATWLIARRRRSTLVLVHLRPLLEQWVTQLALFLGLDEETIGRIGDGKREPNGRLDVAMVQSLVKGEAVDDIVASYGHVIVDECHHASAWSVERVLGEAKARFVLGLTATPLRRDGHHPIAEMQLGPARFTVDARSQRAQRPFDHRLIVRETAVAPGAADERIQDVYGRLAADEVRNRIILENVREAVRQGRSPILLTRRTDHLDFFAGRLQGIVRNVVVLKGGMTARARKAGRHLLGNLREGEERVILAMGQLVGEGFDDPGLDTLFLAMPVAWKGTLAQYAGRLHRLHPEKREVRIYDYVDSRVPVLLRMFEKRLRGYRAMGYARDEAPLGFAAPKMSEPPLESRVEYDAEALRHFEDDD